MGLQRLWSIPQNASPADGAYLDYNLDDLLGIVALESCRNRCLVVGEDLGTVAPGFRERLQETQMLSYRVLHFERFENGAYLRPQFYPPLAIAVAGNHDLPPLRGWLLGRDLDLRAAHFGDAVPSAAAREVRRREVMLLRQALSEAGLIGAQSDVADPEAFIEAVHRYLGRTPCVLAMMQLDDWAAEIDPVNLPGTANEYPNWRRKLSLSLEELLVSPKWLTLDEAS